MKTPEPDDSLADSIKKIERRGLPDDFKESLMQELYPDSSETIAAGPWWMPPRWLGFGIAACWIAILSLQLSTPKDNTPLVIHESGTKTEREDNITQRELLAILNIKFDQ